MLKCHTFARFFEKAMNMKKILFAIAALLLLPVFTGCEKDDIDTGLLIGKWMQYQRMDEDGEKENVGPETGEEYYVEFQEGGVGVMTNNGATGNFTWKVSGTTLSVFGEQDYVGDMEMTIDRLTSDELVLMTSESYEGHVYRYYAYFRRVE